ncbi:TadE/TadG family type IV pilus assembly protein [Amycolatopsis sp. NPDC059021]|uniref:TadE/TadG family type IV pilus assembly protein n=1 Tax=Amycolatopsis sp. NPDC059021 TaxID=3346704 RepID=UPI00366F59B2
MTSHSELATIRPGWTRLRRALCARLGGDRGSESVGLAVLFPVVLLLILVIVQGGLWWHAHTIAVQAAQAGADAGRPVAATTDAAADAARSFTSRAGQGVLTGPAVHAVVTADRVQVTVTGTAPRLLPIPGWDIRVDASARTVKERFTLPGGAGS